MSRKPGPDGLRNTAAYIRLNPVELAELKECARRHGISQADVVRALIRAEYRFEVLFPHPFGRPKAGER